MKVDLRTTPKHAEAQWRRRWTKARMPNEHKLSACSAFSSLRRSGGLRSASKVRP